MKRNLIMKAFVFVLLASCIQCSKGGDEVFVPDLTKDWRSTANANDHFFFLVNDPNKNTSSFSGNENITGGGSFQFTGSFTNKTIQFTFDNASGSKSGKSYNGTINDASNVMTLSSSTLGSLVLEKQ
jgi:hypothetical protein